MKPCMRGGHLPGLIHPDPKRCSESASVRSASAGTSLRYPGIKKITVCEIEPVIPPASTRGLLRPAGLPDVYHNLRTHIVCDDARHYLLTTTEKFDVIASDPLDVFVKGTGRAHSKEYFESVKSHLVPAACSRFMYRSTRPTSLRLCS